MQAMQDTNSDAKSESTPVKSSGINMRLSLISALLLAVSLYMISVALITYGKGLASLQYKMYDARVEKIEEHFDAIGIRKEAVMSFKVDGSEKSATMPVPFGRVMKRGEQTVVYCDPADTKEAVLSQEVDYDVVIVMGAFGFFILSFGIFIGIKSRKA